jgi:hypothetical protein
MNRERLGMLIFLISDLAVIFFVVGGCNIGSTQCTPEAEPSGPELNRTHKINKRFSQDNLTTTSRTPITTTGMRMSTTTSIDGI